jgi:hypothetical protein
MWRHLVVPNLHLRPKKHAEGFNAAIRSSREAVGLDLV